MEPEGLPPSSQKLAIEMEDFHGGDSFAYVLSGCLSADWLVEVSVSERHAVSIFRSSLLQSTRRLNPKDHQKSSSHTDRILPFTLVSQVVFL